MEDTSEKKPGFEWRNFPTLRTVTRFVKPVKFEKRYLDRFSKFVWTIRPVATSLLGANSERFVIKKKKFSKPVFSKKEKFHILTSRCVRSFDMAWFPSDTGWQCLVGEITCVKQGNIKNQMELSK